MLRQASLKTVSMVLDLTEAVVQKAGERRIVVELPGETDPERALATIQQTGLLEFVDMSTLSPRTRHSIWSDR